MTLLKQLQAAQVRLKKVTTGVGVLAKIADVLDLAWLVTLLNALVLVLLFMAFLLLALLRAVKSLAVASWKTLASWLSDVVVTIKGLLTLLVATLISRYSPKNTYKNDLEC